jgi:cell fate regulator YaaT (PSP1 superfamily)
MPMVIGVVLRRIKDKIYVAAGGCSDLKLKDKIILETEHGIEVGTVCEKEKVAQKGKDPMGKVLRKITEEDKKKLAENERKNLKAQDIVLQKAIKYKLDMKLTCVQYTFDRSKLFVYYTSGTRVDFRGLVKDLGHILRTRIQMVQIGTRDESKIVGGIGICGYVLCCRTFLKNFNSVTIGMAKEQDLSLNAAKLSGLCGRLMCCISYENDAYRNVKKELPEIGTTILTPEGRAKITAIDCIREKVTVDFSDKSSKVFTAKQINERNKKGK